MAPIPHIRLFRIYLIALAGSFFLAASGPVAAQPRKDIFKKECVKIHKLYDALLARDTVRYKKLLAGIECSEASKYLIAVRYMTEAARSAYPILIRRDYSGTDDFCAKYRLAEQAAPYRDKGIVHLLGEAVYRETGVAAP